MIKNDTNFYTIVLSVVESRADPLIMKSMNRFVAGIR